MSTHNIFFYGEIWKIIHKLNISPNTHFNCSFGYEYCKYKTVQILSDYLLAQMEISVKMFKTFIIVWELKGPLHHKKVQSNARNQNHCIAP